MTIYLRTYADSVRDFGHAVVIGFGHEMNAHLLLGLRPRPAADVHRRLAAHRDAVPRPGRRQRHLAMDASRGPPGHRAGLGLVAGRPLRLLGRHRRLLLPSLRYLRQRLRRTIGQVRMFTEQPVLLSETAVGPAAGQFTRSATCSPACASPRRSGWCGSTSPSTAGSTIRTGGSRTARGQAAFRLGVSSLTLARPSGGRRPKQWPAGSRREPAGPAGNPRQQAPSPPPRAAFSQHLDMGSLGPAARCRGRGGRHARCGPGRRPSDPAAGSAGPRRDLGIQVLRSISSRCGTVSSRSCDASSPSSTSWPSTLRNLITSSNSACRCSPDTNPSPWPSAPRPCWVIPPADTTRT